MDKFLFGLGMLILTIGVMCIAGFAIGAECYNKHPNSNFKKPKDRESNYGFLVVMLIVSTFVALAGIGVAYKGATAY